MKISCFPMGYRFVCKWVWNVSPKVALGPEYTNGRIHNQLQTYPVACWIVEDPCSADIRIEPMCTTLSYPSQTQKKEGIVRTGTDIFKYMLKCCEPQSWWVWEWDEMRKQILPQGLLLLKWGRKKKDIHNKVSIHAKEENPGFNPGV